MTWINLIDWLTAPTEQDKAEAWQRCHPGISATHYTVCPDIKRFWNSPLGRLYKDCVSIISFFTSLGRRFEVLQWRLSWAWRSHIHTVRAKPD